jgi:hypothetical protein
MFRLQAISFFSKDLQLQQLKGFTSLWIVKIELGTVMYLVEDLNEKKNLTNDIAIIIGLQKSIKKEVYFREEWFASGNSAQCVLFSSDSHRALVLSKQTPLLAFFQLLFALPF